MLFRLFKPVRLPIPLAAVHIDQKVLLCIVQAVDPVDQKIAVLRRNALVSCRPVRTHVHRLFRETEADRGPKGLFDHHIDLLDICNALHSPV